MARVIKDFVIESSTTTGTGSLTLSGAVNNLRTFASVCSIGDIVRFVIKQIDGYGVTTGAWEVCEGTYSAANTLTRDTVIASSNANALVSFTAGTKHVYLGADATYLSWVREKLSAARTYYVRTDGSDNNTGLANTTGGAFLTIQKAVDVVCNTLDIQDYAVTIQVADGTYTAGVELKDIVGGGTVTIQGNSGTPANVVISTTSATAISSSQYARGYWAIKDMKLQTTTSGRCILVQRGGFLTYTNIVFGACAGNHIEVSAGSTIICLGNYAISGGATNHFISQFGGYLACSGRTITITGTPAFSNAFASSTDAGTISSSGCTFSGSTTGTRYLASTNGVINTVGGGGNYFPGSVAGSVATGGQYV